MHKKVINKLCLLYVMANIFKIKRENEGRKWKEENKNLKKGKFDEDEIQKLMDSLCDHVY